MYVQYGERLKDYFNVNSVLDAFEKSLLNFLTGKLISLLNMINLRERKIHCDAKGN
jgi:hypothetical protein